MRSSVLLTLLPLLSTSLAAPLPASNPSKRLLGLGGGSSGPLGILNPATAPFDSVLDPVTGGTPTDPAAGQDGGLLSGLPVVGDLTDSLPLVGGGGSDGGLLSGLPLLGGNGEDGGLLGSLTGPISGLLNPITDLVGDALDLLVPTTLVCANLGADVLGLVDVDVCACVGLKDGGLWVASDAGVNINLPGLRDGLPDKIRQIGSSAEYPPHVRPTCNGNGGWTCPEPLRRPDGTCGYPYPPVPPPETSSVAPPPVTSSEVSTEAVAPSPTSSAEVTPSPTPEPTPSPTPEPVIEEVQPTPSPTPTPTPEPTPEPTPTETSAPEASAVDAESTTEDEPISIDSAPACGPTGNAVVTDYATITSTSTSTQTETATATTTTTDVVETITIPATAYVAIVTSTVTVTYTETVSDCTGTATETVTITATPTPTP